MFGGNKLFYFIFITLSVVFTCGQPNKKYFRNDYTYLEDTNSFYKIHSPKTWVDAKRRCVLEGANFFYPEDSEEANAVLNFLNKTQQLAPSIFVGISSTLAKDVFLTIDGIPMRNIYDRWISGEPNDDNGEEDCVTMGRNGLYRDEKCNNKLPFICKKTVQSLKWNNQCNVPDLDYKYNEETGTCYKFHLNPLSWRNAAEACEAEQSYLAIPNGQTEANFLANITAAAPKDSIRGGYIRGAVHLGFSYDEKYNDWMTIKGQTLAQAGYNGWAYYQPDGGENERCGSMFYGGELNDIGCEVHKCFFICERENDSINMISNEVDGKVVNN